jgi:hypothetical protein
MADQNWIEQAREDLQKLTKEQLIENIIRKRKETYSKVGKRNVATSKSHERRCKKLLTDWAGVEFRRRRIEGRGDDVTVLEGVADIIPVEGKVIVAIESKKGENFSFDGLFVNPHGAKFTEWWHQVNYDARLLTEKTGEKRWPMLFFKPHPNWDWIAVPTACFTQGIFRKKYWIPGDENIHMTRCWFQHIKYDAYGWLGPIEHNVAASNKNKVLKAIELEPCTICRWKDFAEEVHPQSIFVAQT